MSLKQADRVEETLPHHSLIMWMCVFLAVSSKPWRVKPGFDESSREVVPMSIGAEVFIEWNHRRHCTIKTETSYFIRIPIIRKSKVVALHSDFSCAVIGQESPDSLES